MQNCSFSYVPIESLGFTLRTFVLMSLLSISVYVCAHYTFCMLHVQFSVQQLSFSGVPIQEMKSGLEDDSDRKQQCSQRREAHRVKRRGTAVTTGICCTFFSSCHLFSCSFTKAHCCHIRKKNKASFALQCETITLIMKVSCFYTILFTK